MHFDLRDLYAMIFRNNLPEKQPFSYLTERLTSKHSSCLTLKMITIRTFKTVAMVTGEPHLHDVLVVGEVEVLVRVVLAARQLRLLVHKLLTDLPAGGTGTGIGRVDYFT